MNKQSKEAYAVVIADDQTLFADGLEQIVNAMPDFKVIGVADNGKRLMQMLNTCKADLVLLDIHMPYMDGFETAEAIRKSFPAMSIIFISMYYEERYRAWIEKTASGGFMIKNVSAAQLRQGLRDVVKGGRVFVLPEEFNKPILKHFKKDFAEVYNLTKTEIEIIQLIANGKSSKQIASERYLSELTVQTHRKNIFRKINANKITDVIAFASRYGIHV